MDHRICTPPPACTHNLFLLRIIGILIFLTGTLGTAQETVNLLQNGEFQNGPDGWNVNAFQPESIQFAEQGGNIYALLNQDPFNNNFTPPIPIP